MDGKVNDGESSDRVEVTIEDQASQARQASQTAQANLTKAAEPRRKGRMRAPQ